jgi:non-ribosomal peptide synthetase-like protein
MEDFMEFPTDGPTHQNTVRDTSVASSIGTDTILARLLADVVGVERVSVDSNFFDDLGADSMVMARFCARVRKRDDLPPVSMPDVYQNPTVRTLAEALAPPATSRVEEQFAEVLADVVGVEQVSVDSHFFDDLGADSMVMARFCARVRKRDDLPPVSMPDIYQHSTAKNLAAALAPAQTDSAVRAGPAPPQVAEAPAPASSWQYALCGSLQFLYLVSASCILALAADAGFDWISAAGADLAAIYLRSALFGAAAFLGLCTLPVLLKWVLIGRWRPKQIRIWSLDYFRFWLVATVVRTNPLVLFVGSPLYPLYLRALGASIGRNVAIFSRHVPVCTDLLSVGDGSVIRKDAFFNCYRADAGVIQTGRVTLGEDVVVGEATVLDIATSLGDGAQLGHSSSLHAGQVVPAGERWHGSPAQHTGVDRYLVEATGCSTLRKVVYTLLQLLTTLLVVAPLMVGGVVILLVEVPYLAALLGSEPLAFTSWTFYQNALVASSVLFFGGVVVGLLLVVSVPRLLNLTIEPGKVYPLYGFHYWCHRVIGRMTNIRFFTYLFGDSSYIINFLGRLGYHLKPVRQTGSNFGLDVKHENPYLSSVGSGTMVADGLSLMNADYSSTSFRLSRVSVGASNFLGNYIAYPTQGRTGDNCLLATKVMVPIDGDIRTGVGLLGSPSFEIPRSVERDSRLDHLSHGAEFRRRLAAKNKHNAVTIALFLLTRWSYVLGITLLALSSVELYHLFGAWAIGAGIATALPFSLFYFTLIERAATMFRALQPQCCSIYEPYFWWHERYWKLSTQPRLVTGTPFRNLALRLLGVQIGRRIFDDGCIIMEKTMVALGDECALNAGSIIQCHSQEDGAFKSDRITIGARCTLGTGALVHYGVTMGDGATLSPDAFLMKGEEVPQHARWAGNPARECRDKIPQPA